MIFDSIEFLSTSVCVLTRKLMEEIALPWFNQMDYQLGHVFTQETRDSDPSPPYPGF